jgi:pilus assembly protein CpaF
VLIGIAGLNHLLIDDSIEEVWINSPRHIFVAREGTNYPIEISITSDDVQLWVEQLLRHSNRRLDLSQPFVDAQLVDGSRLHVAIPDITKQFWAVNVRKFQRSISRLVELEARGVLNQEIRLLLEACVLDGLNIVISGGTGSGKTTLLNCLLNEVNTSERIITCEEVFEISLEQPDSVSMQTRPATLEGKGEITLRHLIREALRMRPQRLVVGEVRQAESLDLLLALNSGHPGMATLHSNSIHESVLKLCTLPLLAGPNVTAEFVSQTVAASIDVLNHVVRLADGKRQIQAIGALTGKLIDQLPEVITLVEMCDGEWKTNAGWQLNRRRGPIFADQIWRSVS